MSEQAMITSETTRQVEMHGIALTESEVRYAIRIQLFPDAADDSYQEAAIREIVAQLFDALEEKESEEIFDAEAALRELQEASGHTLTLQALGTSLLSFVKLEDFLQENEVTVEENPVDVAIEFIAGVQEELEDEKATVEALEAQIDSLAKFILSEVPGEPCYNEGAIDTAIRIIRRLQSECKSASHVSAVNRALNNELTELTGKLRNTERIMDMSMNIEGQLREELETLKRRLV